MLLERDQLLHSLRAQLDDARRGNGSLAFIAGEAGAGKTSLVRELASSVDNSVDVLEGACDPLTTPRPLSPLHDFASNPTSGLDGLIGSDRAAFEMFELVLDRIRTPTRPVLMIIEDVHWADGATLDFLRYIGRRVADAKAVAVCTYRDDEVGGDHPLRPVLGQLLPLASTHRHLVPALSIDAVAELTHGSRRDPVELLRVTGGNAFFVTEILGSDADVPDSVQSAVLARVARLPPDSRDVVAAVSIAPRSLDVDHAATLVDATIDAVDATLATGVLIGDGRTLRFRHELARAAVEESLPPARRVDLHRRMLALLTADADPDVARLAHHAIRAGAGEQTIEYAPAAAREASTRGAHREAISFYDAAIGEHDRLGEAAAAAALRYELAAELSSLDQNERAVDALDHALAHLRTVGSIAERGRALNLLAMLCWRTRRHDRSAAALAEVLGLPDGPDTREVKAQAHYRWAYLHMLARHGAPARQELATARAMADADTAPTLGWQIDMIDGCIELVAGDASAGVRRLRESYDAAVALAAADNVSIALSMLGSGGGEVRAYDDAIPALKQCIEHGTRFDEDYQVAYCRAWLARIAHEQGRWDDAVSLAEAVTATTGRTGIAYITAMSALGRVRVRRGDPGGLGLLDELAELAAAHEVQHGWNAVCGLAEYHWLAGTPERALDVLGSTYERAIATDSEWARGEVGFWMWRLGAIDQPPAGAAEPFALQMTGDWRGAADAWRTFGCPYELASALADGDTDAQFEAVRIFDSLGAAPAARIVREKLHAQGVTGVPRGPIGSTRTNPAGLTDRQVDVLRLIGAGRSNTEIAAELVVSKKTVEHHVSAIYDKLGVRNRAAAAVEATKLVAD